MPSDWTEIGTCEDASGDEVGVFVNYGRVLVSFDSDSGDMVFGPEERDAFIKLWAEAERQAEANAACPVEAVVSGMRSPCQSQRGHDGGHDYIGTPS